MQCNRCGKACKYNDKNIFNCPCDDCKYKNKVSSSSVCRKCIDVECMFKEVSNEQ